MKERDLISLVSNNLTFDNLSFSDDDLKNLVIGKIVEIDKHQIILQDIGYTRISYILDRYKKN